MTNIKEPKYTLASVFNGFVTGVGFMLLLDGIWLFKNWTTSLIAIAVMLLNLYYIKKEPDKLNQK